MRTLLRTAKRFGTETKGAIAILFALTVLPLVFLVGATVDYSRATLVRTDLQSAADGAMLTIGKDLSQSTTTDFAVQARKAFDAGFQRGDGTTITNFVVVKNGPVVALEVTARVPLVFAGILNRDSLNVKAVSEVQLGTTEIEVALVLDNSGSLAEVDKMAQLKRAAKGLIDRLETASTSATMASVKISVVPFDTLVRVSATNPPPSWVRMLTTPYDDTNDRTWDGCITDRDQPYDVRSPPASEMLATLYPGIYPSCWGLQRIMPLNSNFTALRAHVDGMNPNWNTNTTIGLAWGLNTLTPGAPLSSTAQAPKPNLKKHIVFVTDGENTLNRWTTDRVQIDARTSLICDEIKLAKITLHTIRVVEGNETLLKNCASDPSLYHSVTSATNLTPIFDKVANQIIAIRIAR